MIASSIGVRTFVVLTWGESLAKRGSAKPPDTFIAEPLGLTREQARDLFDRAWPEVE